jgi:hypothetical protein
VASIRYCGDAYRVATADGKTHQWWEFNLRFKTDGSADGPSATLLINPRGREVGRKLGEARWDDPAIVELVRQYLPGGEREKSAHG